MNRLPRRVRLTGGRSEPVYGPEQYQSPGTPWGWPKRRSGMPQGTRMINRRRLKKRKKEGE